MTDAADTTLMGTLLGDTYRIEKLIGEGGMGAVYEASHVRVPRRFAIKMLNAMALADPDVFQRFRREAEIASSLGHENITQVFDFNHTPDGVPFMVLELLKGEDLQQRLHRVGKLTLMETAELLEQVASGLEAAHEQGIVHRDLKPPNLFLCPRSKGGDRVKILDFGISKITNSTSMATQTGALLGTANYMSPEQADGRVGEIDARTDVFALGCILFECLTGQLAFDGPTLMGTLYDIVHNAPADLRTLEPDLPHGIQQVIMGALSKSLSTRTPTVGALLNDFLAACPIENRPPVRGITENTGATAIAAPISQSSTILGVGNTLAAPPKKGHTLRYALAIGAGLVLAMVAIVLLPTTNKPSTESPNLPSEVLSSVSATDASPKVADTKDAGPNDAGPNDAGQLILLAPSTATKTKTENKKKTRKPRKPKWDPLGER